MKIVLMFFFSIFVIPVFAQNGNLLKIEYDQQNVVSSAMEGSWQRKNSDSFFDAIKFEKDPSVLKTISARYYDVFSSKKIYFAGFVKITMKGKMTSYPFLLTEISGNSHAFLFMERGGDPVGDAESFNLFIAKGNSDAEDRLFIGGDMNNQAFYEYERISVKK